MKKQFCTYCFENTDCKYEEQEITKVIRNNNISYLEKYYVCSKCNNKIYGDMFNYNVHAANDELRKISGLIRKSEIEEILDKYSISQKNLSKVLGFGEIQISRYLKSGNPSKEHSDILKSIKDNPFIFEGYLLNAKDILDEKTYKKQLGKVVQLELASSHSKIYNIGIYLIENIHDITNLSLQKILYFLNGFSKTFLGDYLFNDCAQAWTHGPVYPCMYDAFSYYFKDTIDKSEILKDKELDLTDKEKEYIASVSKYFTCYSGSRLRNMSHLTDPWINARVGLSDSDVSDRNIEEKDIEEYFNKVVCDYNIVTIEDIGRYAEDLFKSCEK